MFLLRMAPEERHRCYLNLRGSSSVQRPFLEDFTLKIDLNFLSFRHLMCEFDSIDRFGHCAKSIESFQISEGVLSTLSTHIF